MATMNGRSYKELRKQHKSSNFKYPVYFLAGLGVLIGLVFAIAIVLPCAFEFGKWLGYTLGSWYYGI